MLNISVVVPILNAARTLPSCLAALEKLEPTPREILLVDNGSTDGSLELIRHFVQHHPARAQVIQQSKSGASAARNAGANAAQGDIVAFTDSDCAPEADWLVHLCQPFTDPTVGAVAGRVVGHPCGASLELFSSLYTFQTGDEARRHDTWSPWVGGYPTANLAIRRSILQELHGFDETIQLYGEDYDLCARVYGGGRCLIYTPMAKVLHHQRTTLAGLLRQAFGFGRSHAYLFERHRPAGLWLELPRRSLIWRGCPISAWIDGASADKKLVLLCGVALLYAPCWWLPLLYGGWLVAAAKRRAERRGHNISIVTASQLAILLVLKAGAMTLGRWQGSVRYGRLCI